MVTVAARGWFPQIRQVFQLQPKLNYKGSYQLSSSKYGYVLSHYGVIFFFLLLFLL